MSGDVIGNGGTTFQVTRAGRTTNLLYKSSARHADH